jgi:type II pantothenate kinase
MRVAIDFGATNTDVVVHDSQLHYWTVPSEGRPDAARILAILAAGGLAIDDVGAIAVTGGDHGALPAQVAGRPVRRIGEMDAIGRGGLAMAGLTAAAVASAGSGTAIVAAALEGCRHITGTGVGGGTLLGLGRMLLGTADPGAIDTLARQGRHAGVNLTIGDVIGESIAGLPADTTAVNFGKLARAALSPSREDLAAGLVNMVGQVIAVVAISAARSQQLEQIVLIGHLADLPSVRETVAQVGQFYGAPMIFPEQPGYATVLGALLASERAGV